MICSLITRSFSATPHTCHISKYDMQVPLHSSISPTSPTHIPSCNRYQWHGIESCSGSCGTSFYPTALQWIIVPVPDLWLLSLLSAMAGRRKDACPPPPSTVWSHGDPAKSFANQLTYYPDRGLWVAEPRHPHHLWAVGAQEGASPGNHRSKIFTTLGSNKISLLSLKPLTSLPSSRYD